MDQKRFMLHEKFQQNASKVGIFLEHKNQMKTCSKGFEQKVATLRLKILVKIKENFIGNKTIAKEITRNAGPS